MFILMLLHIRSSPFKANFFAEASTLQKNTAPDHFCCFLIDRQYKWRSLNIWPFFQTEKNINHKKTMSSFPIPRAVLPAGNGAEWINVLLKLMCDDKGIAVLTAEPEGCKVREIPPSWCIPLIQNKPCYASGSSTFTITIKHFSLHFSYLCVLSSTNYLSEALR